MLLRLSVLASPASKLAGSSRLTMSFPQRAAFAEVTREEGGGATVHRAQRLPVAVGLVGRRPGNEVRPDALGGRSQDPCDPNWVSGIGAFGEQRPAHGLASAIVVLILGAAFLLEQWPALSFAPEGGPGAEAGRCADGRAEIGANHGIQLTSGRRLRAFQRRVPVHAIFLRQKCQGLFEKLVLGLEMEIDQRLREPGALGDVGERGPRIAALGQ